MKVVEDFNNFLRRMTLEEKPARHATLHFFLWFFGVFSIAGILSDSMQKNAEDQWASDRW